jgi:anti-sigma-K factor RskA
MPVNPIQSASDPHDPAEELLPWYATGQLDEAERARVEDHLYSCAACREQLTLERRLMSEFRSTSPQVESGWARLKARIDPPRTARLAKPMFAELWAILSRPAVAMLAAAQLAVIVVGGGALYSLTRPDYHVLGSTPAPAAANAIVIFGPDTKDFDVRAALNSAGASIVGGPTEAGAYLIHIDAPKRSAALARLQSSGGVQLAQPIDGTVP